ncbi:rhomboid family intramembrane serine protease [Lachnobacterium bovis]|uniref:GlpG protein n=1 Tax=Lachnobacterium bovis TaxID=140626 RepID=A0A1H9SZG8_9FIRM|nr:rhomboid family intramembrane serine protease [Lachnobacterium bovis]SER90412.1 GlpG protein [Lachnobacterium bovis]
MNKFLEKFKITNNSPVIVVFTLLCFGAYILSQLVGYKINHMFFSVYRSSLTNPLTYLRFFTHVLGHASREHLIGNITLLLVVGPLLEEKYGSKNILVIILLTAFITGIVNYMFFPGRALLGASGVVFAFILLSPFTNTKSGYVPITLILVALFYIGGQVFDGLFVKSNVSNLSHIIGGVIGASFGFVLQKR